MALSSFDVIDSVLRLRGVGLAQARLSGSYTGLPEEIRKRREQAQEDLFS